MSVKRAVIFANGEVKDYNQLRSILHADDLIIAADGGLHHCTALGITPAVLIGDLDSVQLGEVQTARNQGVHILQFPVDKDETDLQLAIDHAVAADCSEIVIAGALGGRLDQTLGNIFLLQQPVHPEISLRLDDGMDEVFLVRSSADISGTSGDIVSLLPLDGPVFDVKTYNLKYPLDYEKLFPDQTRGISNVMQSTHASVSISRGTLICIHSRQPIPVN